MIIKSIKARSIRDSRKQLTIQIAVNGQKASSPSGKSTGKYETPCYQKSLKDSISKINNLKELKSLDINKFQDLKKVEKIIKKKFRLSSAKKFGANALFALESAILKALAKSERKELWQIINSRARRMPVPLGNAIGGGLHSHNKNAPIFQEFLLIPKSNSIRQNVKMMNLVYKKLKKIIKTNSKNDEGAWQTSLNNEQVLQILKQFHQIRIGIDAASSSFYKKGEYNYRNKSLNKQAQIHYINSLIKKYNIFYFEDPMEEEDFKGFSKIKKRFLVAGDDLTATQISRLKKAIKTKSINSMIIKPNQNGSLLELKEIFDICKKHKIKTILSHRSGETTDTALADYAFGFQADFIKTGISTKWRAGKLKRLIQIEKGLQ